MYFQDTLLSVSEKWLLDISLGTSGGRFCGLVYDVWILSGKRNARESIAQW